MESLGCVVGVQDGHLVTVCDHEIELDGHLTRLPPAILNDPTHPVVCHYCDQRLIRHHRNSRPYLRHLSGEAHEPPVLEHNGESGRHADLKNFIARSYQYSRSWTATTELHTESRTRRPDVTCRPRTRRRTGPRRLIERVPTAFEVQLSDIGVAEMHTRTVDHRIDGLEATFWLEAGDEPRERPSVAAAVTLTDDDQVVGVANNADELWTMRDWGDPVDLDEFCEQLRRGEVVWTPDYGVLTYDAWADYLQAGGV